MPYKRVGKTVYKKLPNGKLKSVGSSDSIEKAKSHLKALYSAENKSLNEALSKMNREELSDKIRAVVKKILGNTSIPPSTPSSPHKEYDELTNFPELKKVIVDLLTPDFDKFLNSIEWVAPRPTTFRINLKNDQEFYLIYSKRSWIAQIEGKKYYLLNLPEEEHAAEAISRILRYGKKEQPPVEKETTGGGAEDLGGGFGGGTTPEATPEETPEETPTEETP